jgi:hypothetical protein
MRQIGVAGRSFRSAALFAVWVGVGASVSGCVISGGSDPITSCFPDLNVRWRILSGGSIATCEDVGATTIRVSVGGDVADFACPVGQSTGFIPYYLDVAGNYTVAISLLDGNNVLAQNGSSVAVDCSGFAQTPVMDLAVGTGCSPDLTISWRIISNLDGAVLTCAEAGGADTLTAWIDGGPLGTTLTPFDSTCPANSTQGSFVALLPASGTYNVSLELLKGATLLSETPVLVQPVDCSGLSATPRADLLVNF